MIRSRAPARRPAFARLQRLEFAPPSDFSSCRRSFSSGMRHVVMQSKNCDAILKNLTLVGALASVVALAGCTEKGASVSTPVSASVPSSATATTAASASPPNQESAPDAEAQVHPGSQAAGATIPMTFKIKVDKGGKCDEARAMQPHTPTLTSQATGDTLTVTIKNVNDYCATDADYAAVRRQDGGIYIQKAKPKTVSRCMCVRDLVFTISQVPTGAYDLTYEEVPYAGDAGVTKIATGKAVVHQP